MVENNKKKQEKNTNYINRNLHDTLSVRRYLTLNFRLREVTAMSLNIKLLRTKIIYDIYVICFEHLHGKKD